MSSLSHSERSNLETKSKGKDNKKAPVPEGPTLKRNLLIRSGETGEGRGRFGEKVPAQPEELKTAERALEFGRFLDDHLTELLKASKKDSSFLQNTAFESDRNLVRMLTNHGEVDKAKITEFLGKEENWGVVDQAMVKDSILKMGAIGTVYSIRDLQREENIAQRVDVYTGIDAGFVDNLINGIAVPWIRRMRAGAGGMNPFRRGIVLQQAQSVDAFNAIAGDSRLKAYAKGMYGIDTDDYQVIRGALVSRRPGERFSQTEVSIRNQVQRQLSAQLMTHMKYYRDLGVQRGDFDVIPTIGLHGNPEVPGVGLTGEVNAEFNPNNGGFVDRWGQTKESPYFCRERAPEATHTVGLDTARVMTRAEFNLGNLNVRESLANYIAAQERVINKRVQRSIKEVLADHKKDANTAGELRKKETTLKANNGVESRLVKDAKARKQRLEAERDNLGINQERIDAVDTFEEKAARVRELEQKLDAEYTLSAPRSNFLLDVEKEIESATKEIGSISGGTGLKKRISEESIKKKNRISELTKKNVDAIDISKLGTQEKDKKGWIKFREDEGRAIRSANETASEEFDGLIAEFQQEQKKYEDKIARLESLKEEYKTASQEKEIAEKAVIKNAPIDLLVSRSGYEAVSAGITGGVSDDQLRQMSVDEIFNHLTRPISLFKFDISTPERVNELRRRIVNAKAYENASIKISAKTEEEAQKIEEYDRSSVYQQDAYKNITEPGTGIATIKPTDLLNMSEQQLIHLLKAPPYNWPSVFLTSNLEELRAAQAEARKKLRIRYGVYLEDKAADYDNQIAALDKVITDGMDGQEKAKFVGVAADLVERQEEILSGKSEEQLKVVGTGKQDKDEGIAAVAAHPDTFFSNASMANDARFTEAERVFGSQRGYLEMMNLLFDYQRRGDREAYFEEIVKVLPPQKLAEILNEQMGLGLSKRSSLRTVFTNLQARTTLGTQDLIPPFLAIVRDVRDRALVI